MTVHSFQGLKAAYGLGDLKVHLDSERGVETINKVTVTGSYYDGTVIVT